MAKRVKHKLRKDLLYYCSLGLLWIGRIVPEDLIRAIGVCGGWCAYYILRRERRRTLQNLAIAYGEKSNGWRARIARAVFVNMGRNMAEITLFPRLDRERLLGMVTMDGKEIVDRVLEKGKGIIIITGHIGNWELIPAYFVTGRGYTGGVVARRIYYEKYDRILRALRISKGYRVFYRDESPREILKALRNNEVVGILADQDVRKLKGVFVDFFGIAAYTPAAPVLIAMKSGASLVPARIVREGSRHRIIVDEPIELRITGDAEGDLVYNTRQWSRRIEGYIRERPDQWVWMHRRWKTRPEDVPKEGVIG